MLASRLLSSALYVRACWHESSVESRLASRAPVSSSAPVCNHRWFGVAARCYITRVPPRLAVRCALVSVDGVWGVLVGLIKFPAFLCGLRPVHRPRPPTPFTGPVHRAHPPARSWARGPLFAPARSSVRRPRPLPLLAAARARAAPHTGGGGRRGARSKRGTAREVSGARVTRDPAVWGARAAGGARRAERPLASRASLCFVFVCPLDLPPERAPVRSRGHAPQPPC